MQLVATADPEPAETISTLPGPGDTASAEESLSTLNGLIRELSEDHRIVLLMHDAEGYSLPEIETLTGVALGTLKSRLHRARAALKKSLQGA